jgi:hypothetical protein
MTFNFVPDLLSEVLCQRKHERPAPHQLIERILGFALVSVLSRLAAAEVLVDLKTGFEAIHHGHVDVQNNHIKPVSGLGLNNLNCLQAVVRSGQVEQGL